jgi:hypothetical protein
MITVRHIERLLRWAGWSRMEAQCEISRNRGFLEGIL